MTPWSRTILRLSGRALEPAPERKSEQQPTSVFRRFFATLARMDRRACAETTREPGGAGMSMRGSSVVSAVRTRPGPCEVKFAGAPLAKVSGDGLFEGYASLFGVVDLGRDRVAPGAFRDSLVRKRALAIKLLWQHDPTHPLGVWEEIVEDARGLRVRGRLNLSVAKAREVHALMRTGAVDGLSIGFRAERARKDATTGIRHLEKLDLWEISIVTFPMLPGARVSTVKRLGGASAEAVIAAVVRGAAQRLSGSLQRPG